MITASGKNDFTERLGAMTRPVCAVALNADHLVSHPPPNIFSRHRRTLITSNSSPSKTICFTGFLPLSLSRFSHRNLRTTAELADASVSNCDLQTTSPLHGNTSISGKCYSTSVVTADSPR